MIEIAVWVGVLTGGFALVALAWSARFPSRGIWPPRDGKRADWIVWPVTFAHFGAVVWLAIAGWGGLDWPLWLRFGAGGALLILGHGLMMPSVRNFGYDKTSGASDGLVLGGLYRYSRNPQYLGDIAILLGWVVLSAAPLAALVAVFGVAVFLVAPLAEEPWLEAQYGADYRDYCARVRRFV